MYEFNIYEKDVEDIYLHSKNSLRTNGSYLSVRSSTKDNVENLIFLKELIERAKIRDVIDKTYPFEKLPNDHRYVDKGHKKGNVVITMEHNDG